MKRMEDITMKKLVAILLVLAAMMGAVAFAEDMGVQVGHRLPRPWP